MQMHKETLAYCCVGVFGLLSTKPYGYCITMSDHHGLHMLCPLAEQTEMLIRTSTDILYWQAPLICNSHITSRSRDQIFTSYSWVLHSPFMFEFSCFRAVETSLHRSRLTWHQRHLCLRQCLLTPCQGYGGNFSSIVLFHSCLHKLWHASLMEMSYAGTSSCSLLIVDRKKLLVSVYVCSVKGYNNNYM